MALAGIINEEKYGTDARSANEMIERLTSIDWYSQAGVKCNEAEKKVEQFMSAIGVSEYKIKWLSAAQVSEAVSRLTFESSILWEVLKDLPDQLKEKIDAAGNEKLLADIVDKVPEAVFHGAYKQALNVFRDEKAIKFLVGHAMYISVLACTAELTGDVNPFSYIVELLEDGHLPLGPEGNTFYLL
ncbi:hypothetical protein AKG34_11295 [Peribacillus butanolivorans]|uniref:hypothetical protein n=1 Tax=Peribacillus butanolivorans TaxID=421767 RepID=UPI0006A6FFD7|nr:hypothetical protein [Peribacillus butanolivorans]KON69290.1 hypothetical protein AKG34_11295 [Peribacillus butanolivorans]